MYNNMYAIKKTYFSCILYIKPWHLLHQVIFIQNKNKDESLEAARINMFFLKRHNQAKSIKKIVHLPVKRDIVTKFPYFLF